MSAAVAALSVALWFPEAARAQCHFEVSAIIQGPSCGIFGPAQVEVHGMNDLGQVVGEVWECAAGPSRFPFVWSEETGVVLLPLPEGATTGRAVDINNVLGNDGFGQIACTLSGLALGGDRAYLYDDGEWTELPPSAGTFSDAHAINDTGQLAGTRTTPTGSHGFVWQEGVFTDIVSPIGGIAACRSINGAGVVAGILFGPDHAFVWNGREVQDLGTVLGGPSAGALAINSYGDVVGFAKVVSPRNQSANHPFVILDDAPIDLGIPDGFTSASAEDINDADQVTIRASAVGSGGGYLWQNGQMRAINSLYDPVPGLLFFGSVGSSVNNVGQIAGTGTFSSQGLVGVVLTPVDRPLGDVNLDCNVDALDLSQILKEWGPCDERTSCLCDIVTSESFAPPADGRVDGADLAVVLGNWSPRPPPD